ncbi:hypothetical protein KUCAC02_006752, partial [Chaenocephalus aceratus]
NTLWPCSGGRSIRGGGVSGGAEYQGGRSIRGGYMSGSKELTQSLMLRSDDGEPGEVVSPCARGRHSVTVNVSPLEPTSFKRPQCCALSWNDP